MLSIEDLMEIDESFPFDSYRQNQKKILQKSIRDLKEGIDVVIIEGPTGFGKSAVNVGIANFFGDDKSFYTSPQVQLVNQLTEDFGPDELAIDGGKGDIIPLLGMRNYICRETGQESDICEHYLNGLCKDQENCTYSEQKKAAKDAQTIILTFAKLVIDTSLSARHLLIVDEAHSLEGQTASMFCGFTVSPYTLPDSVWEEIQPTMPDSEDIDDFFLWLSDVKNVCEEYQRNSKCTARENRNIENIITKISYLLDVELVRRRPWVVNLEEISYHDEMVKRPHFKPVRVNKFLQRKVWNRGKQIVLSTATVPFRNNPKKWLQRIGLGDAEFSFHSVPMNFPVENRPVITSTMGGKMTRKKEEENWDENVDTVNKILRKHEGEKGVIHTQSYSRAEKLAQDLERDSLFLHTDKLDADVIDEWRDSGHEVLLSPAVKEGVDLKNDICRYQILFKVPYPNLGDNRVSYLVEEKADWNWFRQETIKDVVQSYGRAVRSKDDHAKFYIVDGSFRKLVSKDSETFPRWFGEAMGYGEEEYDDFDDKRNQDITPYHLWAMSEGDISPFEVYQEINDEGGSKNDY